MVCGPATARNCTRARLATEASWSAVQTGAAGRGLTATLDPSGLNRTTTHSYSPADDVLTTTLTSNGTTVSRSESMYDKLGRALAETTYASTGLVPVFRWTFDAISGGSTPDTAGNTRGTVTPGAEWSWDRAGSVALTGAGAAVTADQPVVDTGRAYSVGLWVQVADQSADRTVLSMPGASGQPALQLRYLRTGAWQLTANGRTGAGGTAALTVRSADGTAPAGAWTHLAATVDPVGRTVALYRDGTPLGTPGTGTGTDFVPSPAAGTQPAWTTTRSAPGEAGTPTSPCRCSRWPGWLPSAPPNNKKGFRCRPRPARADQRPRSPPPDRRAAARAPPGQRAHHRLVTLPTSSPMAITAIPLATTINLVPLQY